MPLYEYQCAKCGKRTERIENFSGPFLKKCPKCGGRLERLVSAPAIQFKGSGWYVTDYAKSSSGGEKKSSEGSSEAAKTTEKGDGKAESKSESKTGDKTSGAKEKKKAAGKDK